MKTLLVVLCALLSIEAQEVSRPAIRGVAHIAIYSRDVNASREFYHGLLGYEEAFDLKQPDGSLALTFFKINERQYIELFPERDAAGDRLSHIALEVDDAKRMRDYLASSNIAVPAVVGKGRIGNSNFTIHDPDGHTVEIVQYEPDSVSSRMRGKGLGAARISDRLGHVGILVGSLDKAVAFYGGMLGFEETWRGSRDGKTLNWVNLKVPEGDSYVEFMLYAGAPPAPNERGTDHHLCLYADDIEKARAVLESRKGTYSRPLEVKTGINRRRQLNLFDPDGTRIELMEPVTVDGKPAPSSNAAAPAGN